MKTLGSLIGCILIVVFLGGAVVRAIFEDPCKGSGNYRDYEDYTNNDYYEDDEDDEDE